MVPPPRIEPGSMDFQSTAMTTFAKAAWCFHRESNSGLARTKGVYYHYTMEAKLATVNYLTCQGSNGLSHLLNY